MLKLTLLGSVALVAALHPSTAEGRTVTIPFNASNFSHPLDIDNPYFPLIPGTTWTYKADTVDGCEVVITHVTNDTKQLAGVTTRVLHDQAFEGETCDHVELVENTFDYHAQDNAGNVWYFGEDTFDCEGAGNCERGEGSWLAGVHGAKAGIFMLAHPRSGDGYAQELAPGVAEDHALVTEVGITARMRRDDAFRRSYSNCIVTKEWTPLERGQIEFKTYCPNIGNVLVIEHHGKPLRSELTDFSTPADALRFRVPPKH